MRDANGAPPLHSLLPSSFLAHSPFKTCCLELTCTFFVCPLLVAKKIYVVQKIEPCSFSKTCQVYNRNRARSGSLYNRPVRVGARSGLGPIWAHMGPYVFLKKVTFRVQTAPFDKITIEFWRSRRRLYIPDLLKAKKLRRQIIIF